MQSALLFNPVVCLFILSVYRPQLAWWQRLLLSFIPELGVVATIVDKRTRAVASLGVGLVRLAIVVQQLSPPPACHHQQNVYSLAAVVVSFC